MGSMYAAVLFISIDNTSPVEPVVAIERSVFYRETSVHGGAGTTATGLKGGCPTTIIPFFGDQFFLVDRVHEKGVGPATIPITELCVERLSNAINFMLDLEITDTGLPRTKRYGKQPQKVLDPDELDGSIGHDSAFEPKRATTPRY
ncbi:Sterol 3-beta-glucosyltransferase [Nymphaea thermarum]|nr:Sterol 3-beta-glucosyltransferase [Nymphaea thermarum]